MMGNVSSIHPKNMKQLTTKKYNPNFQKINLGRFPKNIMV